MKRDDQLTLKEAHHVTARAVAKTEALRQSGCFVAADLSGEPVVVRRMDATAGGAYDIVRGKALGAALLGESSSSFAARVLKFPPQIFAAYQRLMRAQPFPGAGAVPLLRGTVTIGAISSGVRIGPFVKLPGLDPAELLVDGQPTNLEDLIISYAVGGPYRPEHGDDMARWQEAYGAAPAAGLTGTGLQEVPLATRQPVLDNAMARAARVIAHANALGEAVTVVLADRHGHVVTVDRMDGAPPATVRMAEGVALTAAALQIRTCELAGNPPALSTEVLHSIGPHLLPLAGGCPLFANGEYLGAIGIAGRHPVRAQQLADQAAIPE